MSSRLSPQFITLHDLSSVAVTGCLGCLCGSPALAQPVIISQPANQFLAPGNTANFSVSESGAGPFTYQWLFDGTAIAGRTGRTLSLANPQPAQWGEYSVIVSNPAGSVTSQAAQLKVFVATSHSLSRIETKTDGLVHMTFTGETTSASPRTTISIHWRPRRT